MTGLGTLALLLLGGQAEPVRLAVDLSDAPRRQIHAVLSIPAAPGPMTLVFPKWIPGEHGPNGPLADLANLRIRAGGAEVIWTRDAEDLHALHVRVPKGTSRLEVTVDSLEPPPGVDGFSSSSSTTPRLAVLSWNHLLLYPLGADVHRLPVLASVTLPAGWSLGTALAVSGSEGATVRFAATTVETLVDSPVLAGRYLRRVALGPPDGPAHALVVAADSPEATVVPPEFVKQLDRLVAEAGQLFGARHYRAYTFLVSLSDQVAHFGLEHHESSDDRAGERALLDPELRLELGVVLAHEFVHSWNGKYRRPEGLATRDYQQPMHGELLWIYEGLTQYLGEVLAARSGLTGASAFRDEMALVADQMSLQAGRDWRPLGDTATAASVLFGARPDGLSQRRGTDFYDEGALLWLEVDALIRTQTSGQRSLDDFARRFYGGESGPPEVRPYRLEEVLAALEVVAPRDWRAFFEERVERVRRAPPVEGLTAAGWRLAYGPEPSSRERSKEASEHVVWLGGSLGLLMGREGLILDVVPGTPAAKAGVPSGARLVGIGGRTATKERIEAAVAASARGAPVELLILDGDSYLSVRLDYAAGARHPVLERDQSRPDLLDAIVAPHVRAAPSAEPARALR
jgi:predicted metalloprotease with PDZ domain